MDLARALGILATKARVGGVAVSQAPDFYVRFAACTAARGVNLPGGLVTDAQYANGIAATIYGAIETLGPNATIAEIVGAGTLPEAWLAIGALGASYVAGVLAGCAMSSI